MRIAAKKGPKAEKILYPGIILPVIRLFSLHGVDQRLLGLLWFVLRLRFFLGESWVAVPSIDALDAQRSLPLR